MFKWFLCFVLINVRCFRVPLKCLRVPPFENKIRIYIPTSSLENALTKTVFKQVLSLERNVVTRALGQKPMLSKSKGYYYLRILMKWEL
jgi:hypothetical protein